MIRQRTRLEIYCDILRAIKKNGHSGAKRTIIQRQSRMSYDRLVKYLDEMKKYHLIINHKQVHISDKGVKYLRDCKTLDIQISLFERKYLK